MLHSSCLDDIKMDLLMNKLNAHKIESSGHTGNKGSLNKCSLYNSTE